MRIKERLKRRLRYVKYFLFGYSTTTPSEAAWEREYREGEWARLDDLTELAHYSVILGYCRRFRSTSILDVGCGQGGLARMLKTLAYERYLGLDISASAAAKATAEL